MLWTSAFSWYTLFRSYQWKTLRKLRFRFAIFHQKWVFSAGSSLPHIVKTLKLTVWAFSLNFLHDSTLFVIDTHQNMPFSLILTPFDHFQIRPTFAVTPNLILEPCHNWVQNWGRSKLCPTFQWVVRTTEFLRSKGVGKLGPRQPGPICLELSQKVHMMTNRIRKHCIFVWQSCFHFIGCNNKFEQEMVAL